jgi:hypothetical protein
MADPSVPPKHTLQRTTSDYTDKGGTKAPAWEGRGEEEADDTRGRVHCETGVSIRTQRGGMSLWK